MSAPPSGMSGDNDNTVRVAHMIDEDPFGDDDDFGHASAPTSSSTLADFHRLVEDQMRCRAWRMASGKARCLVVGIAIALLCAAISAFIGISLLASVCAENSAKATAMFVFLLISAATFSVLVWLAAGRQWVALVS